jgi:murein DD-endopeptidase MepM/ murein hydrolase activator NlpD
VSFAQAVLAATLSGLPAVDATDMDMLQKKNLAIPVQGVKAKELRDTFEEGRGKRRHDALDILAPRGTPVIAAGDGRIAKLFTSAAGGITIYQFDPDERFTFYYAHLDHYAEGVKQGTAVKKGDVIGYVGTTGNAPKNTPHLHFAIFRLGPEKQWWKGAAINPYPVLATR